MEKENYLVIGLMFGVVIAFGGIIGFFITNKEEPYIEEPLSIQQASQTLQLFETTNQTEEQPTIIANLADEDPEWNFYLDIDDINITPYYSYNETHSILTFYLSSANLTKTNKGGYKWKIQVNYTDELGVFQSYNFRTNLNKHDLNQNYSFALHINITGFRASIGEFSSTIDGSATSDSTRLSNLDNLCRTSDGKMHIAYEGGGGDIWYGNSSDGGNTWTVKEILAGSFDDTLLICDNDDDMWLFFDNENSCYSYNSTDGGATWTQEGSDITGGLDCALINCDIANDDARHCAFKTSGGAAYYVNSSQWGESATITTQVLDTTSEDADEVEFLVTQTGELFAFGVGTDSDDIRVWSPELGGWGAANDVDIRTTTNGYSSSQRDGMDATSENGKLFTCDTLEQDLYFCNSSVGDGNTWTCTAVAASGSFDDCSIGAFDHGEIWIAATQGDTAINIYNWTGTGSISFEERVVHATLRDYPTIMDNKYWSAMNCSDNMFYWAHTHTGFSDVLFDEFNTSTSCPGGGGGDTCDYSSGTWNIDCSESCVVDSASNVGGNNVIASGSGKITQTASITNWAEFEIKGGCEWSCDIADCIMQ